MKKERHAKIIEIMQRQNVITIKELSELLNCTEMTVRRNLDELQEMNFVKRERGYAVLLQSAKDTDYYIEIGEHQQEKHAIATVAMQYIHPLQNICMDSGTTIQQLIMMLPKNMSLSVITPSLMAALTLSNHTDIQILIPGGLMHHSNRSILISDPEWISQYQADIAFLSCRSFRVPGGAFEHSQTLTTTKRALASIAKKKILLLDYSKWNVNSLCNSLKLSDLDIIITDNKAPLELVTKAAQCGIEILLVNPADNSVQEHFNEQQI
ncbi:DeoR/GlpR family DNA-binding transcription regulator [Ruminococcus sp. 5_1_39BFAA]|uniref:DeoR/GlpR family DNA-binding transcription regulator n=1 Tax=Ruminococcus sp. 5_1_39BFAA TaxID=457412 RepID=UPI003569B4FB